MNFLPKQLAHKFPSRNAEEHHHVLGRVHRRPCHPRTDAPPCRVPQRDLEATSTSQTQDITSRHHDRTFRTSYFAIDSVPVQDDDTQRHESRHGHHAQPIPVMALGIRQVQKRQRGSMDLHTQPCGPPNHGQVGANLCTFSQDLGITDSAQHSRPCTCTTHNTGPLRGDPQHHSSFPTTDGGQVQHHIRRHDHAGGSNITFRKVHADVQLHRTWPSVDAAVKSKQEHDTFLLSDDWPTNIWTDTLQKMTTTSPWTAPIESDIRTKLTIDHIFHDVIPHMIWTPRFAVPLTPQQLHAVQISTKAAHVLHRLWDPLLFTFADPCHSSQGHDTKHSSQPHLTEKFYKITNGEQVPVIAIPASSVREAHADWAWFQSHHQPQMPFRWLALPLSATNLARSHSVYWITHNEGGQVRRQHARHVHQPNWFTLDGVPTPFEQDPSLEPDQALPTPTQQEWEDFISHRRALLELQQRTTVDQQGVSHEWHYVR